MARVLEICTSSFRRVGTIVHLLNYYSYIDHHQVQADFIATRDIDTALANIFQNMGCRVIKLASRDRTPILYFTNLVKLIKKEKYDIVRVHGNSGLLAVEMLAAWLGGCKTRIVHSHSTKTQHPLLSRLLCPLLYVVSNVRFSCGIEAGRFLFGKKDFIVIPNGIDAGKYKFCEKIRKRVRAQWGIGDAFVIGHVGNINAEKNHRFLIDIFAELKKYDKECVLVSIGMGNIDELKLQCEKYGIADSVYFLGKRDDVPQQLQGFDIAVLPSLYEGFPLVAVEWQAAGLPCYISDKVTREIAFSDKVHFVPLETGAGKWAEIIWNDHEREVQIHREDGEESVKKAGYDISENAKILVEQFQSLIAQRSENA